MTPLRIVLCSLLVGAAMTAAGAGPASAASPTLTVAPSAPMAGERFDASTRLTTRFARTAKLQRYSGGSWRTVSTRTSSSTGAVTFSTATTTTVKLRIYAPSVRRGSKRYDSQRTASRTVTPVPQTVKHVLSARDGDGAMSVAVTATPARTGRTVTLQQAAAGGAWTDVASTTTSATGTAVLAGAVPGATAEGRTYRVLVAAASGAGPVASAPSVFRGTPMAVVAAADLAERPDGSVRLEATTTGVVSKVRFYVDGSEVGVDDAAPWSVPWTPVRGQHDLVARAVGPTGTRLSPAVLVDRPAGTVDETAGVPDGFSVETVQSGFDLPTSFAVPDLDHVLVAEKAGRVLMFGRGTDGLPTTPRVVLDLTDRVLQQEDRGLIGLVADPDFADNGHVYVSYVLDDGTDGGRRAQAQQVVRYTMVDDRIDPATRHVVLGSVTGPACYELAAIDTPDCLPLGGYTHTVGDLAFDDAGRLLVSIGDGALLTLADSAEGREQTMRAQDPDVLAGKVLRVDPATGRGVPGNPFYDASAPTPGASNASRVLALGFRNPFRISVRGGGDGDPSNDQVMVGDVGEGRTEEVDAIVPGGGRNFGWPCLEGTAPSLLPGFEDPASPFHPCIALRAATGDAAPVPPAYGYPHVAGASVTGGVIYTGDAYPAEYRGAYFFGDYAASFIRTAVVDHHGGVDEVAPFATADAAGGPVKLVDGPDGAIWFLSVYTGTVRRLGYSPEPVPGRCGIGSFARTFHDLDGDDSTFDRDYPENAGWLRFAEATLPDEPVVPGTCVDSVALPSTDGTPWTDDDQREHPGDRFGVRWQGRVELAGGTYRFDPRGQDWVRLWVDGERVFDWFGTTDWWQTVGGVAAPVVRLPKGIHTVRVELVHDVGAASADVTWERVGEPPTVSLDLPADGVVVAPGASVPYATTASPGATVEVVAELLHHSGGDVHVHPYATTDDGTGSLTFEDEHAPGGSVYRVRAVATDASGSTTRSAPAYVCLTGNRVGICGTS